MIEKIKQLKLGKKIVSYVKGPMRASSIDEHDCKILKIVKIDDNIE